MKCLFSFDDCTANDVRAADLMTKYGFAKQTIFYWPVLPRIANEPRGRSSLNDHQMQEIASTFTLGSHTLSHRLLTRIPLHDARQEIFESRRILQEKFNQPINSFSYPRGYANPDLEKLVEQAGYTNARSTIVGHIHPSENPFFQPVTVHAGYKRNEYGGVPWLDYARRMVELVQNMPNSEFRLMAHSWELDKFSEWHNFEVLLKQLAELKDV